MLKKLVILSQHLTEHTLHQELSALCIVPHLIPSSTPWKTNYHYAHFTDQKTEAHSKILCIGWEESHVEPHGALTSKKLQQKASIGVLSSPEGGSPRSAWCYQGATWEKKGEQSMQGIGPQSFYSWPQAVWLGPLCIPKVPQAKYHSLVTSLRIVYVSTWPHRLKERAVSDPFWRLPCPGQHRDLNEMSRLMPCEGHKSWCFSGLGGKVPHFRSSTSTRQPNRCIEPLND